MTVQGKTTVKSYFETGDFPTQDQFTDLIDSYFDYNAALDDAMERVSAGASGVPYFLSPVSASILTVGEIGAQILSVQTTASLAVVFPPTALASAGEGLKISANASGGTLKFAIQDLVEVSTANLNTDFFVIYETSANRHRKIKPANAGVTPVSAASQAEMEAATSITTYASPGRTQYHPGVAKSWVNFNGTGVISVLASYNVASIADNGIGDYTVNFTVPFSSTNYAANLSSSTILNNPGFLSEDTYLTLRTASAIRVLSMNSNSGFPSDKSRISCSFFGDQA